MKSKKQLLFPKYQKILEQTGENIKLARKRRKFTAIQVAERAGINRSTLYEIEKGNPSVSLGAYFNTLRVLGLQNDFLKLAADDEYGRKLQDLELTGKSSDANYAAAKATLASPADKSLLEGFLEFSGRYRILGYNGSQFSQLGTTFQGTITFKF